MIQFSVGEKIFYAWDDDSQPDWSENNIYDAGPDGLSGEKEGFYFANWLMPIKDPFVFMGHRISTVHYPNCINIEQFSCNDCEFFLPDTCPLFVDQGNFNITRLGFRVFQALVYYPRGNHIDLFDATHKELRAHGKPLHYEVLFKILNERYLNLDVTASKLHKLLKINPVFFDNLGDGAFRTIPGINRNDGILPF